MEMNTIQPAVGARTKSFRVGRGIGSGLGKTCGRGHKGSYARTGKGKIKPGFEGGQMPMQRRLPKVGFRSKMKASRGEIYLYQIEQMKVDVIDLQILHAAGFISSEVTKVKVVLRGEITRAVTLKGLVATAGAAKAVIAAGGKVE
jgi:large subunit ribosomal protein L15